MRIERHYTKTGQSPYRDIEFQQTKSEIRNPDGSTVFAQTGIEVPAAWSQVAKTSGETYLNLKIGAPEFGPNWVRARLVKLEHPTDDSATHIALWEPRDR